MVAHLHLKLHKRPDFNANSLHPLQGRSASNELACVFSEVPQGLAYRLCHAQDVSH